MEFDLHVRVMRETYRELLGIRDGLEADARFLAFCREYVHVYDESYRTLHAYLASQQDPSPPSPTISISSAPAVMSSNPSTPQASSSPSSAATTQALTPSSAAATSEVRTPSSEFFYHENYWATLGVPNSVFWPFFVDYPLLPSDMINCLLNTVSTINFALEKVVRTWGEPQKKSFSTNIWSLSQICQSMVSQGTKLLGTSNDAQNAFR